MNSKKPHSRINDGLRDRLLDRIESEGIKPRSRSFFMCHECMVWSLWGASVVIGSFAVAVSLFVVGHSQYALYEATHDNFITFMVEALPYLWIAIFGLMVYFSMRNMRNTKRGYKYSVTSILVSSILLSVIGGWALHSVGLGYKVDDMMGKTMPMYMSQEKTERKLWQAPTEGRLLGKQVLGTVSTTTTLVFEDSVGQRWQMNVSEMKEEDLQLLASGDVVRVLGEVINLELRIFHSCGTFPWMLDPDMTKKELSKERQAFVDKVYKYSHYPDERLAILEDKTFSTSTTHDRSICAEIAAVKRVTKTLH